MKWLISAALVAVAGAVADPPVGTVGHGTCGIFPPGGIKANGNCKKDPKGWHPHTKSFEDCVALIKAEKCTMARYVSWGITEGGMWCGNSSLPCQLRGESSCGWYNECDSQTSAKTAPPTPAQAVQPPNALRHIPILPPW